MRPANRAIPSSQTRSMTWLFRSLPTSLSARRVRMACSAGIGIEPGRSAWLRTSARRMSRISGTKNQRPPSRVRKDRGSRLKRPDVGHGGRLGPGGLGPFLIEASGQACEALLAEEDRQGIDADVVPGGGQLAADVVDGEVPLPHGDDQVADAIARGRRVRPLAGGREEGGALGGVMAELVAEDAEGPRGVAEAASDLVGGESLDEVGAEGLVLSLERRFGGQEEPRPGGHRLGRNED